MTQVARTHASTRQPEAQASCHATAWSSTAHAKRGPHLRKKKEPCLVGLKPELVADFSGETAAGGDLSAQHRTFAVRT
eukprot:2205928-Rhodomonas_salina.2